MRVLGMAATLRSYPALRQDRHASKGVSNARASNELQTARRIAVHQLIAEALKEAQHIPAADAFAEAEAGRIVAAKATVEGVYDDRLKPVAQCLIGGVQVKSGDLIGAKTTVEEIGRKRRLLTKRQIPALWSANAPARPLRHCSTAGLHGHKPMPKT